MTLIWCHMTKKGSIRRQGFALAMTVLLLCRGAIGFASSPVPGTPLVNQAIMHYGDANGNPLPAINATVSMSIFAAPLFLLEKTADSDPVAAGASYNYTIHYQNTGNAAATGVQIVDTLPADLTFQSATGGGVHNPANNTVTWSIGNLASGSSGVLVLTVKAAANSAIGTQILNTVLMTSNEGAHASAKLTTAVGTAPNLTILDTSSAATVYPGGTITYTISYANAGNSNATGVVIVNSLPIGTALVNGSISGGGLLTGQTIKWFLGSLPPGSSGSVSFQAAASPLAGNGDIISNVSTIKCNEAGVVTSNQLKVMVLSAVPLLTISDSATAVTVSPGGTITYTISYGNSGKGAAAGVVIKNDLPNGTVLVPGSITAGGTVSGSTISWPIGALQAGAAGSVSFQVTVPTTAVNGSIINNVSTILSNDTPLVTSNQLAITVTAPALAITKTVLTETAHCGNPLTYEIVVKNSGLLQAFGIQIEDQLPAGVSYVKSDGGGVFLSDTVSWYIAALEPGVSVTLHLDVLLDKNFSGSAVSNTAFVSAFGVAKSSASVEKIVAPRTPGLIEFIDAPGANSKKIYQVNIGDKICVQVTDADRNTDPLAIESVSLSIDHLFKTAGNAEITDDSVTTILMETSSNSGIFQGCIDSNGGPPTAGDAILSLGQDSSIKATYTDPLDANPVSTASAFIDPFGIVFNSVTGKPVSNVIVRLIDDATGLDAVLPQPPLVPAVQENPVTTADKGQFQFKYLNPGTYHFVVTPNNGATSKFTFPSTVEDADLPAGYILLPGSRGKSFTLATGMQPLNIDIPVDPPPGLLNISKTANKTMAAIGDLIVYSLKISNTGVAPVKNITLTDVMPHGIKVLPKTSRLNGVPLADPKVTGVRKVSWSLPDLAPEQTIEITYRAVVGPDSTRGDGVNAAFASGTTLGLPVTSNTAKVRVKISLGIFSEKGTIIGKVFHDRDGNRMQNQSEPQGDIKTTDEPGVAKVAIYLEDGTRVITDGNGKFSIPGVMPGTHVLRVDETTLPKGMILVPLSNRFLGDGASQFVDMRASGIFQADFAVKVISANMSEQNKPSDEIIPVQRVTSGSSPAGYGDEKATLTAIAPVDTGKRAQTFPAADFKISEGAGSEISRTTMQPAAAKVEIPAIPLFPGGNRPAAAGREVMTPSLPTAESPQSALLKTPPEKGSADAPPLYPLKTGGRDWEKEIRTMTPDIDFLSPVDGSMLIRDRTRVVLKAPFGTDPSLSLNGLSVNARQIGRKIDYEQGRVTIFEYIDIPLKAGERNVLKAEVRDPFGIIRGSKEISVTAAGAPEKIMIRTDKQELPADGSSVMRVEVTLRDRSDRIIPYETFATVSVSAGEIVERDANSNQDDFQIHIKDGVGQFTIRAPRETGEAVIVAGTYGRQEILRVFFSPNLRSFFVVGSGEVTIGYDRGKRDYKFLNDNIWSDNSFYAGGRGAFFLKGTVYDDILLTAAFDSEKKKRDDLFRENDTNLLGEDKYPIYGDESRIGYEAVSADKLYVKLEKNRSSLLYGDYKTDLNDTRLSAYNRYFNGLKYDLNTEAYKLRSFASYTDQTQVMDILPGKGISGYYYLTKKPVIEGSERVVIETRDRYRPDNVLSRDSKVRGSDYDIDYDLGGILFKEPIPSHNSDYNPVYIVVSYESRTYGEKYFIYGGRGAVKPYPWLEVGVTGVVEEKSLGNATLTGTDWTLKLPHKTVVKAEYAETKSIFMETGPFAWRSGEAWSVNMESEPINKLLVTGYYRTLSDYFINPSAADSTRGTTKYGFDASYEVRPETRIKGRYFNESDDLNDMRNQFASVGLETKFNKTKITGAISNQSSSENYIPLTNPNNRSPFDISQEIPHSLTDVKLGIETELRPDLSVSLNHKQNLSQENYHMSQAGLNYQVNTQNRFYLREEYQKYQDRDETRTLFGVESQVVKNTVAYNEYRLADGADGARNQNVLGLRNKFFIGNNVTGNASAEYLKTISGQQRKAEPDAVGGSLGLEYLASDQLKTTGRFEHRRELIDNGKDSYLGEVGMAYKLHPDYSLLMREQYFTEGNGIGGEHTTSRTMVGVAYRPLLTNRFNALSKLEYKHESNTTSMPAFSQDAWIYSGEGVWRTTPWLQLTGKYAGKLVVEDNYSSYTDMITARFLYDLTNRWDVGVEYRILNSYAVNTVQQGGALEIGYMVIKNLWVSAGYSFDKFDPDLAGDSYYGEGPYIKLRVKFDENLLRGTK